MYRSIIAGFVVVLFGASVLLAGPLAPQTTQVVNNDGSITTTTSSSYTLPASQIQGQIDSLTKQIATLQAKLDTLQGLQTQSQAVLKASPPVSLPPQ